MNRLWCGLLAAALLPLAGCGGRPSAGAAGDKSYADWMAAGEANLTKGDLDEALGAFDSAADKSPDSAEARERRGYVYFRQDQFDKAIADCDEALKINSKLAAAYFTRSLAEKGQGDTARAVDDVSKALDLNSDKAEYFAARGGLYQQMAAAGGAADQASKLRDGAVKDFDRALKIDARDTNCLVRRAEIYLDTGDYRAAIADCDNALQISPNLSTARIARARGLTESGEYDKAVLDCDAAIALDDKRMDGYVARAKARVEKSGEMLTLEDVADCDKAADDCGKAVALANLVKGDAEALRRVKKLCAVVHELRGILYDGVGANKKAYDEFTKAISLDPYLADALVRRGMNCARNSDYAGGLRDCNAAIDIDGSRPGGYYGRGVINNREQRYSEAIKDLNEALTRDANYARAHVELATVYYAMAFDERSRAMRAPEGGERAASAARIKEDLAKCADEATRALKANPHSSEAYLARGLAYANLQFLPRAFDDLNSAIRENRRNVNAFFNRATFFVNTRHYSQALADFTKVIELQPNGRRAIQSYKRRAAIYRAMRDPISAMADEKKIQEYKDRPLSDEQATLAADRKADLQLGSDAPSKAIYKAEGDIEKKLDAAAFL